LTFGNGELSLHTHNLNDHTILYLNKYKLVYRSQYKIAYMYVLKLFWNNLNIQNMLFGF